MGTTMNDITTATKLVQPGSWENFRVATGPGYMSYIAHMVLHNVPPGSQLAKRTQARMERLSLSPETEYAAGIRPEDMTVYAVFDIGDEWSETTLIISPVPISVHTDARGDRWGVYKLSTEVNWPAYGSTSVDVARRRLSLSLALCDLADQIRALPSVRVRIATKEALDHDAFFETVREAIRAEKSPSKKGHTHMFSRALSPYEDQQLLDMLRACTPISVGAVKYKITRLISNPKEGYPSIGFVYVQLPLVARKSKKGS